jgi:RAT1-interacting protein
MLQEYTFEVARAASVVPSEKLPSYGEPKQLAFYSTDIYREVSLDDSQLRYYYLPEASSSLEKRFNIYGGFDTFQARSEFVDERLDHLLRGILLLTERRLQSKEPVILGNHLWFEKARQIITWRGIMTKLLCVPYESTEEWTFEVVRFRVGSLRHVSSVINGVCLLAN